MRFLWWLVRLCPSAIAQSDLICWYCHERWIEQITVPEYRVYYRIGVGICPKCKTKHRNGIPLEPGESMAVDILLGEVK
jgi:hypothetical protein